jgi:16S rRNA (cytosine1402-N4)-methyltransferase
LEDRYVKNFVKKGRFDGEFIKDDFGKIHRPFIAITKKAVEVSAAELKINPRARSAKLRIAEKV